MNKLKKFLWFSCGLLCLGIAYIGLVTPGIPWSTPSLGAAYCFAHSNERWHSWIMNHKLFGPFITNWQTGRVFPTVGKWFMLITMDISLITIWFTTGNVWLTGGVALLMAMVIVWAWKFPGSVEESRSRQARGDKLGWF